MKRALSNMPEGTTQSEFDESVKKLISIREILQEDTMPSYLTVEDGVAKAGFKDGFKRAFNSIADTYRSQSDYGEKYWYLK